ncbi:MAG: hypothetical protein C3F11_05105 [Methylocystaceae bacterium]|nr:MAG: hypothetical protein C3F11_05105 [Methylocystaceae bacterium]
MTKLRQEVSGATARRDKILAPPPFCQDLNEMSGGILRWPTPGLRSRRRATARSKANSSAKRFES